MNRLVLSPNLLTGIEEIDNQHRELFARGNNVLFPGTGRVTSTDIVRSLLFLLHYVDEHFAAEERLMQNNDYERLEGHCRQHHRLRREVENLYRRMEKNGSAKDLANEIHYLFGDWYVYHIKEWDKPLALFLRNLPVLDTLNIPGLDQMDDGDVEILKTGDELTPAQLRTLQKLRRE